MQDEIKQLERLAHASLGGVALQDAEETSEGPRLADLLEEIAHLIGCYARLPHRELAVLVAVWIAATYLHDRFRYCGYLALRSATPRCGKTRLLRLIAMLAQGVPPITTTPTPAVLFRRQRKVLILDEVDNLRNADKENFGLVIAVLNVGFEKGAVVERTEKAKSGFAVKEWPVYRPTALAGIECLADALADRCFQIQMERTPERMPRFTPRLLDDLVVQLRLGLQTWADAQGEKAETAYEKLPDELEPLRGFDDRFQDIAEPLMVLAAMADGERPEGPPVLPRLIEGLEVAAGRREPSARERQLLTVLDMLNPILGDNESGFIASSALLELCQKREELSRIETARALAGFLRHFDLRPGFNSSKTERGYTVTRAWLTEWRARYGSRHDGGE